MLVHSRFNGCPRHPVDQTAVSVPGNPLQVYILTSWNSGLSVLIFTTDRRGKKKKGLRIPSQGSCWSGSSGPGPTGPTGQLVLPDRSCKGNGKWTPGQRDHPIRDLQ